MKKVLSIALAVCIAIMVICIGVFADNEAIINDSCGDNVTYVLYSDGTLVISGTGKMTDYASYDSVPWYSYASSITTVIIEDGVTSIGRYSFYNYTNLTSITIPDSVTSIGTYAFRGCSSLTSVTIPNGVTSIGSYTFFKCSSLTSVTIPDSVTSIEMGAFYLCSSLTSITIPDSVTSIGSYTFCGCSSLTSITIPNGVISIKSSAFEDCTSLTSVTIPTTVTLIGASAFWNCKALTSIIIPDSVTSIGVNAFYNCTSLRSAHYLGSSSNVTISSNNNSALTNVLHYMTAVETCTDEGYRVYYKCDEDTCGLIIYIGDNGNYVSGTDIVIPTSNHSGNTNTTYTSNGDGTHSIYCSVCENEIEDTRVSCDDYYSNDYINGGDEGHYKECSKCEYKYYSDHKYDEGSYSYDENGHWQGCKYCDYTAESENHSSSETATKVDENNHKCTCDTCGQDYTVEHTYENDDSIVVTDPTCTEKGYTTYTCDDCGYTYDSDYKDASGHELTATSAVASTCTEKGNSAYWYCSTCTKYFDSEDCTNEIDEGDWILELDSDNHNYTTEVTDPTCTDKGYTTYTCEWCGNSYDSDYEDAKGHSLTLTSEVDSTCTVQGNSAYWYCSTCTKYFDSEACDNEIEVDSWILPLDDTNHSYIAGTPVEPTCTEQGYTTYTCEWCNDSYNDDYEDAKGHSLTLTEEVASTCTEKGNSAYYTCNTCGLYFSDENGTNEIDKDSWILPLDNTNHSYKAGETIDPTCTEQGYTTYTCEWCGNTYDSDYKDANGHSYTTETCTNGTTIATCSVCDDMVVTVAGSDEEDTDDFKVVLKESITITDDLATVGYTDEEAIKSALIEYLVQASGVEVVEGSNAVIYDVVLLFREDGGEWQVATVDNFPADGITVVLEYPEGTDADSYDFYVAHMFAYTSDTLGTTAGEFEYPTVTKTADGIQVTLTGLSPVIVSWDEIVIEEDEEEEETTTDEDSADEEEDNTEETDSEDDTTDDTSTTDDSTTTDTTTDDNTTTSTYTNAYIQYIGGILMSGNTSTSTVEDVSTGAGMTAEGSAGGSALAVVSLVGVAMAMAVARKKR